MNNLQLQLTRIAVISLEFITLKLQKNQFWDWIEEIPGFRDRKIDLDPGIETLEKSRGRPTKSSQLT